MNQPTGPIGQARARWWGAALTVVGVLGIAMATLVPTPEMADRVAELPVTCLVCGELGGTDVALNLLLFAPFAAGLTLLGVRPSRVLLVAGLMSLTIETLQISWIPGRDASLSDLLTNTSGATLTALLVHARALFLQPKAKEARALAVAALLCWMIIEAATAWSLAPALPESRYWGQWAADLGFLDLFTGTVQRATVAGDSLPPGRIMDSHGVRERLLKTGGPISADAITGTMPEGLAPIISIFDDHHREILLLGQQRTTILFRLRTRVNEFRLRPPAIRIEDAVSPLAGEQLHLTASYDGGFYRLRVDADGRIIERTLAASPNWGWSFFIPFENYAFGSNQRILTALWIAGLLLPLGYWMTRAGGRGAPLSVAALVAVTLLVVPLLFRLPAVHLSEWGAAALGLSLGSLLGKWSLRWTG
jgi:VanZ like family